VKQLAK